VMLTASKIKPLGLVLFLLYFSSATLAQREGDRWLRVITGEYSTVEIDRNSLKVGPNSSLIAVFRTTFTRSEDDPPKFNSGTGRLDTIEFSIRERKYRILESRRVDGGVTQAVLTDVGISRDWKRCRGGSCPTMFSAVEQLRPFGTWKVTGYRYSSGQEASPDDPEELKMLKGSEVWFKVDSVTVKYKKCDVSSFDGRTITEDDWKSLYGGSIRDLGFGAEQLTAIRFTCKPIDVATQWNFLLRLNQENALLLWEGVFLALKRVQTIFLP
jgi:hypothetical protein